jgi:serine/threonine protein kinase
MRAPTSTIELLDLVRKSGIHPSSQLDDRLRTFPNLPVDPTQTAAMLVKQGMLTKFQAKLLLTGRYRGFRLGSYVVSEQIGQGGMGAVYLAEHETLKRRVALKVLPPAKNDPNAKLTVERFLREARAAAALDHPNIVRIHDVGQQGEVHFLVMEYVEGQTLEDLLQAGGPITPSRAVEYVAQAAAGLQHAHEKGFIHRDIKPANLMLAKDGTVKLLDMGLARSSTNETDKLTERMDEGAIVGTADFISPEQAMNAPNIDIRTDIYSLGATFFALVTGTPPFAGNTTQKLVQHQMKDAPSLTTIDKTFPPELAKVVAKMLHKKPEKRYQSPGEVITAVAEWLPNAGAQRMVVSLSGTDLANSVEMQATLSEIANNGTARISKSRRLGTAGEVPWKLYGGVGAAVAAAVVLVCWMIFGGSPAEPEKPFAGNPTGGNPVQPPPANPNPAPPVNPAPTNPPANPPANRVSTTVTPAARVVHVFDAAEVAPARVVFQNGQSPREGEYPILPAGWQLQVYAKEAVGEFRALDVDGRKAFAVGSVEGEPSAQLCFRPEQGGLKPFAAGRVYEARIEYKVDAGAGGASTVQTTGDWKSVGHVKLTETSWQTATNRFTAPDVPVQVTFKADTTAPGKFLYVRRVEFLDVTDGPTPAPVAAKLVYKLDLSRQQPFLEGGRLVMGTGGQKDWMVTNRTGTGAWPANWNGRPWREGEEAEFFIESNNGQQQIGSRNTKGAGSAMLFTPEIAGLKGACRVELEYRSDGKTSAMPLVRFLPVAPARDKAFDLKKLDPTRGAWKTVTFDADLKGAAAGRFEFHITDLGVGGELRIRKLTVSALDRLPAAGGAGTVVLFRLDPAAVPAFRAVKQGSQTIEGQPGTFPKGVYLHGHKRETLAVVAREDVDGVPAFGITHRNDVPSAQLGLEFERAPTGIGLPLQVGKTYSLKFTYKTTGTAEGVSYFQEYGTWRQLKVQELAPADGWKTVEYEAKKTDQPLRAVIDLKGTGDGNTLYVRDVSLIEVGTGEAPTAAAPAGWASAYKLDLSGQQLFNARGGAERTGDPAEDIRFVQAAKDGAGDWPAGWRGAGWDTDAETAFFAVEKNGRMTLGVRHLRLAAKSPSRGTGMIFTPRMPLPAGKVTLRFTYSSDGAGASEAQVKFKPVKPVATAWEVPTLGSLPGTGGKPVSHEAVVDLRGATEGFFEFHSFLPNPSQAFNLYDFEVLQPGAASPAPPKPAKNLVEAGTVQAFEFGAVKPFRSTFMDGKADSDGGANLPAGAGMNCWNKASVAEFRAEEVAGKVGVGMTNLNDTNSSQLHLHDLTALAAGQSYRMKVEYLTKNDATGRLSVRRPKENYQSIASAELPGTGGAWKTVTVDFTRPPAGVEVDAQVGTPTVGEGNTLYVHKIEIVALKEPTAAAPPAPPAPAAGDGPAVYAVDFAEKGPFEYTIENKKPSLETWKVLPAGVKGLTWKAESKAEFRGVTVNGRAAMAVTNLNDAISSQVQVDVGDKAGDKIAGGKKYRVKVDYLTANDAAGVMAVRTPKEKYSRLVQADLPGTGGEWKTATLDFVAPAATPVDLVVENTTTGAGNTLHVAKVEVVEVK